MRGNAPLGAGMMNESGRAVAAQEQEDERLLALVGCIHGLVLELDGEARYIGIWDDDPRLLAVTREAALGRTPTEALGEAQGAPLTALVKRVFLSGVQEHIEYPLAIGDALHWFWADLKRVRAGDTYTVVVVVRDISDRKRAEEQLRLMEERYRLAARATNDILYDFDTATGSTSWSEAAKCLLGTDREPTTESWAARLHPEDVQRVHAEAGRAFANPGQQTWTTRYRVRRGDGAYAELLDRGFIVRVEGRAVRVVGSLTDVTELNRLQQRLVQSDRLAAIGALAAGVGHEINNPLSYVLGNIEYALDSGPFATAPAAKTKEDDVRVALAEAREGAHRIAEIVRSLKLFSQQDATAVHEMQLETILERSIKMADNEIRHRARLVRDFGDVGTVKGNEGQLAQVCLSLLINAAHSISDGKKDANEIRVATSVDTHGRVVVAISDTGPSIAPEHLGRIFEPFFHTKPGIGRGIGLSVCKALVQSMGGELTVTSERGQPTTFWIVLPRAPAATLPAAPPELSAAPPKPRMLVIDDDAAVGRYIARALRSDCDVTTVVSAREALLEIASGTAFDVILSDMMMPEMNGVELYDVLREEHPELLRRVFFMTGGAFTPETAQLLESLPERSLEKPITKERLLALLVADSLKSPAPR